MKRTSYAIAFLSASIHVAAQPLIQMPFPGGETWRAHTYVGHPPSTYSLDLNWGATAWADLGKPVLAGVSGTVIRYPYGRGYGNYLDIDLGGGWTIRVAHLDQVLVSHGQTVGPLTQIGTVGASGSGDYTSHLHYEQRFLGVPQHVRFDGQPVTYVNYPLYVSLTSKNYGYSQDVLLVHDEDGNRFQRFGNYWWRINGFGSNGGMWFTYANGGILDCSARWTFQVGQAKRVRVEPFIPRNHATGRNVKYVVQINGGPIIAEFRVNQAVLYDQWALGAVINVPANATVQVTVRDDGGDRYPAKIGVDSCRLTAV